MSILINMEMPRSCAECRFLEGEAMDGLCHASEKWLDDDDYFLWCQYPEGDIDDSKPANCPLIEIPPHGNLIDMDAVYEYLEGMQDLAANVGMSYEARCVYAGIIADLREMPTVLEAEGRE